MPTGPDLLPTSQRTEPAPPSRVRPTAAWWRTLWMRAVVVLAGSVGLTTAVLFVSVDHFVKSRFTIVHDVRLTRLIGLTQRTVSEQLAELASIASLLVEDTELVDSTYSYLNLKGGMDRPRAAVARIAAAFRLESVSLWTMDGRQIGAVGDGPPLSVTAFPDDGLGAHTAAIRRGDDIWLLAVATLHGHRGRLARLQLAKRLTTLFRPNQGTGVVVSIAPAVPPPAGAIRVPAVLGGGTDAAIDIIVPDEVGEALADVKTVLALVMTGFGVLLVTTIVVFLRRMFRPVFDVIDATLAVGRGEFGRTVAGGGRNAMGQLVQAFNKMSDDLKRLRRLEREAQHREQLSAIGRVAARVAHDLNNPLTVISNVARLVAARRDIDGQLQDDMKLVLHHCDRSIATIEALLAYGRPIRLTRQQIDLGSLCRGIADRWSARHAEVTLSMAAPPQPLPALVDPYRLEQMLDNLLDNASSFAGRIEIGVGWEGEMAFIAVTDDGPGFSAEAHEHLFEPFFTTRIGGTGLGLASCLAIARAHGGDLDVDAGPPTKVTVWLPSVP